MRIRSLSPFVTIPLLVAACVGDSTTPDAGFDATSDVVTDSTSNDGSVTDAGACNSAAAFGSLVPVSELNGSVGASGLAFLSSDQLTVLFSSDRNDAGGLDFQIWKATRGSVGVPFSAPTVMPNINTKPWNTDAVITTDGLTLYYTGGAPVAQRIYTSTRASVTQDFPAGTVVQALVPQLDAGALLAGFNTYLLPDDKTMYYAGGAFVNPDIYTSTLTSSGWSTPVALASINSPSVEQYVAVTPDQLTIYFGSSRLTGNPAYHNIFKATRASVSVAFGSPAIVPELNANGSTVDQGPSWVSSDGCTIWITNSSSGSLQIYKASKPAP